MRFVDADVVQGIADKELSPEEASAVQFVLSHTPTVLLDAPTSVPKRAHWKWDTRYHDYVCSNCGNWDIKAPNYCSNCGLKMDL